MLTKQEPLLERSAWAESRRVREPRRTSLPCCSVSGLMVKGLVSRLSLASPSDSGSFLEMHALLIKMDSREVGPRRLVGQVASSFDLF